MEEEEQEVLIPPQPPFRLVVLPDEIISNILSYFHVQTLIQKKIICQTWKRIGTELIDSKCPISSRKAFETHQELKMIIKQYVGIETYHETETDNDDNDEVVEGTLSTTYCHRDDVERIATIYGWPIDKWDVSQITNFTGLFSELRTFNESIGNWNISNVTNFNELFKGTISFNQNISNWDTSNVTTMSFTFCDAKQFNQNLSNWDTSSVTSMRCMFWHAHKFNNGNNSNGNDNGDLSTWDTSHVTDMQLMFCCAEQFHQNISSWDVSNVTDRVYMFLGATAMDQDMIPVWNTTAATDNDTGQQQEEEQHHPA